METEHLSCCPKCLSTQIDEYMGLEWGYGNYYYYACSNCGFEFDEPEEIPCPPFEWELQNRECEMQIYGGGTH